VRPDVIVVESGEVVIPGAGEIQFQHGLPPGVEYAWLAEAALLAMEERFECLHAGARPGPARVKEIYRLFRSTDFRDRTVAHLRETAYAGAGGGGRMRGRRAAR